MSFTKHGIFALILAFQSFSSFAHFSTPSTMIAEVKFSNFKIGMWKLNQLHLDVAGYDIKSGKADVVINDYEFKKLKEMGFNVQVKMTKSLMRQPDPQYKKSQDIERLLNEFSTKFPELAEVKEIGKSLQGRSIFGIKISRDVKNHDVTKPVILFNGMHHAREVMGPEVALDIIETLLENYGKDNKITHWVDSNEIWVVPMINVDGNNIVWTDDNMWRKNAREDYGVDINRNYPYAWGSCNGSSSYKGAQDYRGASPASEPETNVMMNLVKTIRPVFDISYHSYSELVIYPMGCKGKRTDNADVVEKIGKAMGQALRYTAGTPWETLYSVDGGDIDWMYAEYQVIPYVIEVNSMMDGFQPEWQVRQPTVERNRKAWQMLLDRLDGSGIRGYVTMKKKFVSDFKIKLQKKNQDQYVDYMTYKGNPDGSFHMITNPGEYRVIVVSEQKEISSKDVIVSNERSILNFDL